ncbi:DUF4091 domain-containing protein [Bacteroides sp. 1001136B_160425_E2]|uniref:DUF4091 domain-containing protein n=1 Tax=Bacteroides sp. 1001136B_160425_E2 TaxID=2787083 RepID=UPI00293D25C1|nr:glycoside hydrolase domain-containing protein [Bacteroides sp. 1001136B_160425_E2]
MLVVSSIGAQQRQTQDLILQWGSTDVRYPRNEVPVWQGNKQWETNAWKGERVNAQAVLWTKQSLKNVRITVSDLKCGKNVIPASATTASFVGYVWTDELNKDRKSGCSDRPNKADWDSSLVADVLEVRKSLDIEAQCTQPLWVNIWVPQDIPSGVYKGALTVSGENFADMCLPMRINVQKRILPDPAQWVFHLDLWQNPYAVARYYNVPLWSRQHFDIMKPLMQQLANAGQKVITASVMHHPWAGQTEDPFDSMVFRMKKIDGSWVYDYTVFDRWVEFMMSLGIDRQINCYTLVPWALKFDYYDQATNRIRFVEAKPGEAAYEDYWFSFLKDFAGHLRQKGWFEKTTIAMDEREKSMMQKAFDLIFRADAGYKVSGAGDYYPEIEPKMYDLCLAYGHTLPDSVREERRRSGKLSTVYTCCIEAYPNTFTFSEPAEASWLMWHAVAGGYDGYLRWAYNSWTKDPLHDSRFRSWAAGDCYLVYPGSSSIRMERLVEGIQDAEKIRILRKEFAESGEAAKLKKLNQTVAGFMPEKLNGQNASQMVRNGRNLLNTF